MIVYPVIRIKEGVCIGLTGDISDAVTVFSNSPVKTAAQWEEKGARYLHVVDMDGAVAGSPRNLHIIHEIISAVNIPVQVSGGIKSMDIAQSVLDLGAQRIVINVGIPDSEEIFKSAVERFGDKLAAGLDVKGKKLVYEGSSELSTVNASDFALKLEDMGVKTIIYTDTTRLGTLQGSDIVGITDILTKVFYVDIVAAGGISDLTDLKRLKRLGVSGAVVGKALYAGEIELTEAQDIL